MSSSSPMPSTLPSTETRGRKLATDGHADPPRARRDSYCSYAICRAPSFPVCTRPRRRPVDDRRRRWRFPWTLTGIFVKMPAGALSDILDVGLCSWPAPSCSRSCRLYLGASSLAALIALRVPHGSATAAVRWLRPRCQTWPPRAAGRMAWHVCHGARGRPGSGPCVGRVSHRRGSIRLGVHRGGSRRARGAPDRRHVVAVPSSPRYARPLASIQVRHPGGAGSSSGFS